MSDKFTNEETQEPKEQTKQKDELCPEDFLRTGFDQIKRGKRQLFFFSVFLVFIFASACGLFYYIIIDIPSKIHLISSNRNDITSLNDQMGTIKKQIQIIQNTEKYPEKKTVNYHGITSFANNSSLTSETFILDDIRYALVADSLMQFSGIQGNNGWYYGYTKTSSKNTFISSRRFEKDKWTVLYARQSGYITKDKILPFSVYNSPTIINPGALRLVSKWNGNIRIVIYSKLITPNLSDGVVIKINIDNDTKWYWELNRTKSDNRIILGPINMEKGRVIDFVFDPKKTNTSDDTEYAIQIYHALED